MINKVKAWMKDERSAAISPELGLYLLLGVIIAIAIVYMVTKAVKGSGIKGRLDFVGNMKGDLDSATANEPKFLQGAD